MEDLIKKNEPLGLKNFGYRAKNKIRMLSLNLNDLLFENRIFRGSPKLNQGI